MLIFDTCRVVTMVIFGGSVLHHALNAQQFIYSYAPHKPTSLSRCCQELPWRYRFLALDFSLSGGCHLQAKTSPGNGSRMPCPVSSNRRLCTSRCSLSSLALSSISQKSRDVDEFTPLVLDNTDVDVDAGEHAARPLPLLPGLPGQGCQLLSWPQEKACKWPSKDFQVKRFDPHGNCFSWWPFHKSSKSTMQWMADFVDMFMYMHVSILVVVITKPCCLKGMSREDKAATNSSTRLLLPAALISDLKTWHSFEKKQCSKRQLKYSSGIWRFDCSLDS